MARRPLQIVVTAAGRENLLFRTLLREAIPLLQNPRAHSCATRGLLLQKIDTALALDLDDDLVAEDPNPFLEDDVEAGCAHTPEEEWS